MRWRRRRAQKKAYAGVARFRRTCHVCAQGVKRLFRRTMNLDGLQKAIKGLLHHNVVEIRMEQGWRAKEIPGMQGRAE